MFCVAWPHSWPTKDITQRQDQFIRSWSNMAQCWPRSKAPPSFPSLLVLQATKSWVGPGNEASTMHEINKWAIAILHEIQAMWETLTLIVAITKTTKLWQVYTGHTADKVTERYINCIHYRYWLVIHIQSWSYHHIVVDLLHYQCSVPQLHV